MLKFIVYSINKTYTQPKSEKIIIHEHAHTKERYYSPGLLHTITGIKQKSGHPQPCSCLLVGTPLPILSPFPGDSTSSWFKHSLALSCGHSHPNTFCQGTQVATKDWDSSCFHCLSCPLLWSLWSQLQSWSSMWKKVPFPPHLKSLETQLLDIGYPSIQLYKWY